MTSRRQTQRTTMRCECIPWRNVSRRRYLACCRVRKNLVSLHFSKQMVVACDKQKTALVCFWSVKYHTRAFVCFWSVKYHTRAFLGVGKALVWYFHSNNTLVHFSYCIKPLTIISKPLHIPAIHCVGPWKWTMKYWYAYTCMRSGIKSGMGDSTYAERGCRPCHLACARSGLPLGHNFHNSQRLLYICIICFAESQILHICKKSEQNSRARGDNNNNKIN
jgi:hypothetical protein